jgi:hypothetical protein
MKKLLLIAASMMVAVGLYAQGTVNFQNIPPVPDAPVFNIDGTTRLSGPNFQAMLYAGPDAGNLAAVGAAVPFLAGEGAGYFIGGSRAIPTVAPGATAFIEVRAWDSTSGASWEVATIRGQSMEPFSLVTGGLSVDGAPPTLPAIMTGMTSFNLVPEPSTIALGILGAGALLLFRRRKVA